MAVAETHELVVFSCVVKHASYARAAEELSLSASGVSRIVTRLEERLGARLVHRTTRKLSLTGVVASDIWRPPALAGPCGSINQRRLRFRPLSHAVMARRSAGHTTELLWPAECGP